MSDWLDDVQADNTAMAEVKAAVEKWRELRFRRDEAESRFKQLEKDYQDYCNDVVAKIFRQNGLESLRLADGSTVEVVSKIRCSIGKSEADKQNVAEWLREHEAGNLVKSQLIVMTSNKAALDKMGIAYDEDVSMNTNSVKAWVKGETESGNVSVAELPKGLSWFVYDEIVSK